MSNAADDSSSSSIDSSNHPCVSSSTSSFLHLSTDLSLGLAIPNSSALREKRVDFWPPVKLYRRNALSDDNESNGHQPSHCHRRPTFFVKVYMEGIPIGRKLDLFCYAGYDGLISTLEHMFRTRILFPFVDRSVHHPDQDHHHHHVLTYEDKDGDWMMVGDVPWKVFLSTVKRLKISKPHKC